MQGSERHLLRAKYVNPQKAMFLPKETPNFKDNFQYSQEIASYFFKKRVGMDYIWTSRRQFPFT